MEFIKGYFFRHIMVINLNTCCCCCSLKGLSLDCRESQHNPGRREEAAISIRPGGV